MQEHDLIVSGWSDYELLDSGDHMKLERFGEIVLARPETQALWRPAQTGIWKRAAAEFRFADGKGDWKKHGAVPDHWPMHWNDTTFLARLMGFKHTGVFPEQAANWKWMADLVGKLEKPKVLNLFGYTGVASVVAAKAGATVTHVDASKQALTWTRENAEVSGVTDGIRYLADDALKFAKREVRRGTRYEGVILDPPAFGRGTKGEVWHIEEDLPELLETVRALLSDAPGSFFLLNGYAAGYAPLSFAQAVESVFGNIESGQYGELRLEESGGGRAIPTGIYVRFVR